MVRKSQGMTLEQLREKQIREQNEFHIKQAKLPWLKKVRIAGEIQRMTETWLNAKIESTSGPDKSGNGE